MSNHSELQVLHSNTGYYIGRVDVNGIPLSKESGYFPTYRSAEEVLIHRFQVKSHSEND